MLTAQEYDAAENVALLRTPNRIVECCQPIVFHTESYPVRIPNEAAAIRYLDVMQDGRTEDTFTSLINGLTADEIAAMRRIAEKVAALTERLYGQRSVPRSGMLRALNVVRHIRYLWPQSGTVLEVGAGSGYVGALLLELGFRYICTDITQAFYLWQNQLLTAIAGNGLAELATSRIEIDQAVADYPAVHLPWWKFVVPSPRTGLRLDVVTCNHAWCEMHPNAMAYTLAVAAEMLQGNGHKAVVFEGWGSTVRHPIWHVGKALAGAGFVFANNDIRASIAVRSDNPAAVHAMVLPIPDANTDEERFHPRIHVDSRNPIGAVCASGRDNTKLATAASLADYDVMLREVLGREDLLTDDERFMRFVADRRR
ncbi:hypothetical protein [Bradyrhizobium sp.]|uniref:hypothetical protein n=1 Tax=Bradyrhizobium sp. TaxID=376 RepID=UPI001EC3B1EE|nr:hypothetical protein [Bradyrhizobium sp.]MBV9984801.1 hypothetical protein [Bradyrhizobium sp.]